MNCKVPINVQDFVSETEEHAHMVADNRLAELSEWDEQELVDILKSLDKDISIAGFDKMELDRLLSALCPGDKPIDPIAEWKQMPEFNSEPAAHRTLFIHFKTADDVKTFEKLVKQPISDKTKFLWYPKR